MSAANEETMGTVEVVYSPGNALSIGLQEYRHKFCDVRLWVEGYAIPAHKLILSMHSTFFQQMFINDAASSSEVYLNDVPYNVLQPIVEFMYTGRAYIDSQVVFDEIKSFSRIINFRPFSKFWGDLVQTNLPMQVNGRNFMAPQPFANVKSAEKLVTCAELPRSVNELTECGSTTQVTNCYPTSQSLCSSSVPTSVPRPTQPITTLPTEQRILGSSPSQVIHRYPALQIGTSEIVTIRPAQTTTFKPYPTPTTPTDLFGFTPTDISNSYTAVQNASNCIRVPAIDLSMNAINRNRTENSIDPNVIRPIIELSDISQIEDNGNTNSVIAIDDTEVDIVELPPMIWSHKQMQIDDGKKSNSRRGRPRKIKEKPEKLYVSTESLFNKTRQSKRGPNGKNVHHRK